MKMVANVHRLIFGGIEMMNAGQLVGVFMNWIKRHYEAVLIAIARKILIDRNVARSAVVSRRDNNDMYAMAEQLEQIETRIKTAYQHA